MFQKVKKKKKIVLLLLKVSQKITALYIFSLIIILFNGPSILFVTHSYKNTFSIIVAVSWDFSLYWKVERVVKNDILLLRYCHLRCWRIWANYAIDSQQFPNQWFSWMKFKIKLCCNWYFILHFYLIFIVSFKRCLLYLWKIKALCRITSIILKCEHYSQ